MIAAIRTACFSATLSALVWAVLFVSPEQFTPAERKAVRVIACVSFVTYCLAGWASRGVTLRIDRDIERSSGPETGHASQSVTVSEDRRA